MPRVAFVLPIIRDAYIYKAVETLYKYTQNFVLIVVDQSIDGLPTKWVDENVHLYIRQKNKGFANAANKGIIHALRDQSITHIATMNDDVEFMYEGWLPDALAEFQSDEKIIAVCPESPRVPLWGYGRPHDEYIDLVEYKENYTLEDIDWLKQGDYSSLKERYELEPTTLPKKIDENRYDWEGKIYLPMDRRPQSAGYGSHDLFPLKKQGVIDGIAMWLPIFKREGLIELGLFDEKFKWGGGEDYDMNTRAYTCAWPIDRTECDPNYHRRMVSTMKSWVWHWWGKSKDVKAELDPRLFEGGEAWNNCDELWPPNINNGNHMDVWGHYEVDGARKPFRRIPEVYVEELG